MNEKKLLSLLEKDSSVDYKILAAQMSCSEDEVAAAIKKLEKEHIIVGYSALVDWSKTERNYVTAMIELKISPVKGEGFDKLARRLAKYPQVQSVALMSGTYYVLLTVEGKTLTDVASFVSQKLAPMDGVLSTATHFMLKRYKDKGIDYEVPEEDTRGLFEVE